MPLSAIRKNGETFTFSHGGEWFDFDFNVKDPHVIEFSFDYPANAVVRTRDGAVKRGTIGNGQWVQVDHDGETAYLTLKTTGYNRSEIRFDAPQSFIVKKGD